MIRPANFGFNSETAGSNSFQHRVNDIESGAIALAGRREFDEVVETLKSCKIDIIIAEDTPEPAKPDAVFPNNWISFHEDGTVVFYPMLAKNRRIERRSDILDQVLKTPYFSYKRLVDYSKFEKRRKFLEGTGSIVLDKEYKIAYASISSRTDEELFINLCTELKMEPFVFRAFDKERKPIYHTNVILTITSEFAIVCCQAIQDEKEKEKLQYKLAGSGKSIIEISMEQVSNFCGNCLELFGPGGESFLIMSTTAYQSFHQTQLADIGRFSKIVTVPIPTIEYYGGGSARCMICEIS